MHQIMFSEKTLITFMVLVVSTLPPATQNTIVTGSLPSLTGPLSKVSAVVGGEVDLPCDSRPPMSNDSLLLVVWYRDDNPVYSFDTRVPEPTSHWTDERFANRAHWINTPTSALRLRGVQSHDRATYRCRVDYQISPTKNFMVSLDVIEIPAKPVIFDEYGKELSGVAGPYNEGGDFKLICSVSGGNPTPTIKWLQGDTVLSTLTSGDLQPTGPTRSLTLSIRNATRAHQSSIYTCMANNTVLSPPQRANVQVDLYCLNEFPDPPLEKRVEILGPTTTRMSVKLRKNLASHLLVCGPNYIHEDFKLSYALNLGLFTSGVMLRPQTVEILSREQPLSVGNTADLWCRSTGARPPAIVTWWLGGKQLTSITKHKGLGNVDETLSLLQWTPTKEYNGTVLTCRAEHSKFNRSTIETKLLLNIYYMPEAKIHFGANMNPNDIEEGDDVYFGCKVDANPPAYKVIWEHNGVILQQSTAASRVILTGITNLALRNVSRFQAGKYSCTASNVEGDGKSQDLFMHVIYKPICKAKDIKLIGAALQEPSRIVCEVESFPPPNTFEWFLNSSAGTIKVDPERYTIDAKEGKSILSYMPVSDVDYGTLSCKASNLAGLQATPCIYTLLPATRPDPPTNCTMYNLTDDSLDLHCLSGYEGGLHCTYIAEVWANEGLVTNSTNAQPLWALRRLGAKRQLKLIVYAANARGRSEHVTFVVETAPRLAPRTEAQAAWEMHWAVGGVFGAAVTVSFILCLALIVSKLRHRSRDYEVTIQSAKTQKATLTNRNIPHEPDDKNPDIIPLSKGIDCQPDPPLYSAVVKTPEPKSSMSLHSLARALSPDAPISPHAQLIDSQNDSSRSGLNVTLKHREIVTTRTPLLGGHQESCV